MDQMTPQTPAAQAIASAPCDPADLRPFYFMIVLWGRRFREYFLEMCLPAMLSPNNIPALRNKGNKFLICTTPADWAEMAKTPIWALMERYIEPVLIEIPPAPPGRSGCEHMGIGHTLATRMAYRDKAYGVLVTPDYIVNDGAIAAVQRHAAAGKRLVLVTALRFAEEPLYEQMHKLGLLQAGETRAQTARPLVATSRQLVAAGLPSLHSEVQRYGWESKAFSDFPVACWWSVPNEDGMVVHSLSWGPLLMDYGSLASHDTTCLETWTLDGDYLYGNFGSRLDDIHIVTDSDEIMQVSWAPLNDRPQDLTPIPSRSRPIIGDLVKGTILRNTVLHPVFDPLKRKLLFIPVRWHARELTRAWRRTEDTALQTLGFYLYGVDPAAPSTSLFALAGPLRAAYATRIALRRALIVTLIQFRYVPRILEMLGRALLFDRSAWSRISRRFRIFSMHLAGKPIRGD